MTQEQKEREAKMMVLQEDLNSFFKGDVIAYKQNFGISVDTDQFFNEDYKFLFTADGEEFYSDKSKLSENLPNLIRYKIINFIDEHKDKDGVVPFESLYIMFESGAFLYGQID